MMMLLIGSNFSQRWR